MKQDYDKLHHYVTIYVKEALVHPFSETIYLKLIFKLNCRT
jgi:hypothetical protein